MKGKGRDPGSVTRIKLQFLWISMVIHACFWAKLSFQLKLFTVLPV